MGPRIQEHDLKLVGVQSVVELDSPEGPGNVVQRSAISRSRVPTGGCRTSRR